MGGILLQTLPELVYILEKRRLYERDSTSTPSFYRSLNLKLNLDLFSVNTLNLSVSTLSTLSTHSSKFIPSPLA